MHKGPNIRFHYAYGCSNIWKYMAMSSHWQKHIKLFLVNINMTVDEFNQHFIN